MTSMKTKFLAILALLFATACAPIHVTAQQPVSFATVQAKVMNAVTAAQATPSGASATSCTPPVAANTACQVPSVGQGFHTVTWTTTGSSGFVRLRLEGSGDGSTWFPISADSTVAISNTIAGGSVYAFGYFAAIRVNLLTFTSGGGATLTANYSGSSGFGPLQGVFNAGQQITNIAWSQSPLPNNTVTEVVLNTSFANTYGQLVYQVSGETAGSSISVSSTDVAGNFVTIAVTPSLTGSAGGTINLPPFATSLIAVDFTSPSGAGNATVSAAIVFSAPPVSSGYSATPVTTDTAFMLKSVQESFLHSITVNKAGVTSTIAVWTGATVVASNCSGGTLIGTIDTTALRQVFFDISGTGVCIQTTGGTPADITITYR
jgi:hypothetical protein